jgi:Leucine-rich repeat (LRR) protein
MHSPKKIKYAMSLSYTYVYFKCIYRLHSILPSFSGLISTMPVHFWCDFALEDISRYLGTEFVVSIMPHVCQEWLTKCHKWTQTLSITWPVKDSELQYIGQQFMSAGSIHIEKGFALSNDGLQVALERIESRTCHELRGLTLSKCLQISNVPSSVFHLHALNELVVDNCPFVTSMGEESLGILSQLRRFQVSECPKLEFIPASIGKLTKLFNVTIKGCRSLKELPRSMELLSSLETIHITDCEQLEASPFKSLKGFLRLKTLMITKCPLVTSIPDDINHLKYLEKLSMAWCKNVKYLPASIVALPRLVELTTCHCNLQELPEGVGMLESLEVLDTSWCQNMTVLPPTIGQLQSLRTLKLDVCTNLQFLPDTVCNLPSLTELSLAYCTNLCTLPESVGNLSSLRKLSLASCSCLLKLPASMKHLQRLEEVMLDDCDSVQHLSDELIQQRLHMMHMLRGCKKGLLQLPSHVWGHYLSNDLDLSGFTTFFYVHSMSMTFILYV